VTRSRAHLGLSNQLFISTIAVFVAGGAGAVIGLHNSRPAEPLRRSISVPIFPGLKYSDVAATALVFVRSTCRFCSNSMPFYKRLVDVADDAHRIVFVTDEPVSVIRSYLSNHDVEARAVISAPFPVDVDSTPTILVIDRRAPCWTVGRPARSQSRGASCATDSRDDRNRVRSATFSARAVDFQPTRPRFTRRSRMA
jgi:hypothetical protein